MQELEIYKKLEIQFLVIGKNTNMAKVGHARKVGVLYVVGRFGFSSKVVFEYLFGISREAINKLFLKLVKEGLLSERKSFGSKDGAVYYLTTKGKRLAEFETELVFNQKTDTSAHNSKTEIHDLSTQICVIDRLINGKGQYTAFVTEKELREIGYGTWGRHKSERAVDALIYHQESGQWHAVEVETANSKNKKTPNHNVRPDILEKYRQQLISPKGLYSRVLFFSHRERFLRQINNRTEQILSENKLAYSEHDISMLQKELKCINSFCSILYNIFWDPTFKLTKPTHINIDIDKINSLKAQIEDNSQLNLEYKSGYLQAISDLNLHT